MYVLKLMPELALLLRELAETIRENQLPVDQYLQQCEAYEMFDPLQATAETTEPYFDPTFWERLGIRHIISGNQHSKTASRDQSPAALETDPHKWCQMRKDACIDTLVNYLGKCSVIQFADYVSVKDAAGFWDGLFADVIKKTINKQAIDFIFQLGDITGRRVFEIDEALDVIGQYAKYGRVTLIMDEQEALKLWDLLCGVDYEPPKKEKFLLQYGTMHIDYLLIFYNNGVLLYTKEGQFEFAGRSWNNIHSFPHSREFFLAGYRLGLLLHLSIPHAIVLGLAVSGAYRATASLPAFRTLLTYLNDWGSAISKI